MYHKETCLTCLQQIIVTSWNCESSDIANDMGLAAAIKPDFGS